MNFARVVPSLWKDSEFKQIVEMGPKHIVLALYLRTNRFSNMLGLYELSLYHMAKETGLGAETETILSRLVEIGYCCYEPESEFIWVTSMADMQVPKPLNSKQRKGIKNQLIRLLTDNDCPFVDLWRKRYGSLIIGMEHDIDEGKHDSGEEEG